MLINEPKNFHDSVKPIVYFNCFVGMAAYRQPNTSDILFFCMQFYTIIIILLHWTVLCMNITGVIASEYYHQGNSLAALTMNQVLTTTNSGIALMSPLLILLQKKGFRECLRQMPILDDIFQNILGARNDYRKDYIRLVWYVIGIILVMLAVGICDTPWMIAVEKSLWSIFSTGFALHYPIIVILVHDLNFYIFVRYLQKKFLDLNNCLLGMAKKLSATDGRNKIFVISRKVSKVGSGLQAKHMKAGSLSNDNHYLLHEIRKVYLELCKLSRKINLTFGIQNLLSMGISFVMVTGLLYTIYSDLARQDPANNGVLRVAPSALWTIIYIFKIWIVNHSCWRLSSEAERTGEVVYELFETRVDKEFQKQIKQFAVQILQNPIRLSACGFFILDYSFVQGVIGSITTYLVILIQMSQGSQSSTFNTASARNGTEISPN